MKFADWTNSSNSIPAGSNIQFYSAQSSNASTAGSAIGITSAGIYSGAMNLNSGTDLDVSKAGRQIQVTVEARVPVGSAGGSYSTSYGVQSTDPDIATVAAAKSAIAAASYIDLQVVSTGNQAQKTAAVQAVVNGVKGTTDAVVTFNAGNYDVAISKGAASDTSTITTATFSQSEADAAALAAAKATAHTALTDALVSYTEANYTAGNWTALNAFKTDGDAAIDAAANLTAVSDAQTAATIGMAGVETII